MSYYEITFYHWSKTKFATKKSIYLSILRTASTYICANQPYLAKHLRVPIDLFIYLCTSLSTYAPRILSSEKFICLSIHNHICTSKGLPVSIQIPIYLPLHLSISRSTTNCEKNHSTHMYGSINLKTHLGTHLST